MISLWSPAAPRARASHPAVTAALRDCRRTAWSVALFSGAVNILMLAGPLYMLQVYDRVLASRSVPTLVALSLLLGGAFALQAVLDLVRGRIVARGAGFLDHHLSSSVYRAVIRLAAGGRAGGDTPEPVRDLDQIRAFLSGQGPIAIVDLPWIPVFLLICALVHPWLGLLSLAGGILLAGATLLTERASRAPARDASQAARTRARQIEADRRNSESATAMGMQGFLETRWLALNATYLASVQRASDVVGFYASLSKITRMALQSAALGLGAYLVMHQELMPGAMIASSVTMARALAPIETAIANWRGFISARDAIRRLKECLTRAGTDPEQTALPKPSNDLAAEGVAITAPEGRQLIVGNISFALAAGEAMGIIGPSGCGKTSLVRALVGVWRPAQGAIRIDGAALEQWPTDIIGPAIGYLSQGVDLFDGTVAENIARMRPDRDDDAVVRAAQAAGAHEMILRLPNGYDTAIGHNGAALSAGQRQRVGLARALYGDPFVIVLDEPNANLDGEGEAALLQAIRDVKQRGGIAILVAHRAAVLAVCDNLLVLCDGTQKAFGATRDLISPKEPRTAAATNPNLRIVSAAAGEGIR